jgi:hypothetical protein
MTFTPRPDTPEAEVEHATAGLAPQDVLQECPHYRVCEWCKQPGHDAEEHPLPAGHPAYDAFYDATDDQLCNLLDGATFPDGTYLFPGSGRTR